MLISRGSIASSGGKRLGIVVPAYSYKGNYYYGSSPGFPSLDCQGGTIVTNHNPSTGICNIDVNMNIAYQTANQSWEGSTTDFRLDRVVTTLKILTANGSTVTIFNKRLSTNSQVNGSYDVSLDSAPSKCIIEYNYMERRKWSNGSISETDKGIIKTETVSIGFL